MTENNIINKLEFYFNKIILKLRFIQKKHTLVNQYCKKCGTEMHYDYHVSNADWEKLPEKYLERILCLHCFCQEYPGDLNDINLIFFKIRENYDEK